MLDILHKANWLPMDEKELYDSVLIRSDIQLSDQGTYDRALKYLFRRKLVECAFNRSELGDAAYRLTLAGARIAINPGSL